MATQAQIMGGLRILEKYSEPNAQEFLRAEHDQIWVGGDDDLVSSEDAAQLEQLGWFVAENAWSRFV